MASINRHSFLIAPQPPLLEWVNQVFPERPSPTVVDPLEHEQATIYLIPAFHSLEEAMAWLEENYLYFFELQLWNWCTDESYWPDDRSWRRFQQWCQVTYIAAVENTVEGVIREVEE